MAHKQYEIEVWGTVLFIDATSSTLDAAGIDAAIEKVKEFVFRVDEEFSTYKPDSMVSKLRRGDITIEECSAEVVEVWSACALASELTDGAFNPWSVPGGFDPSGYVKGWAADKCADILVKTGCESVQVNAAGDLTLRGGHIEKSGAIEPWTIGVTNPDNKLEVLQIFKITNGAIATSGESERGAHIHDPFTATIAIGAKSATVVGPDGGLADALATALMVSGEEGAAWFRNPDLAEYSAWLIDRHSDTSWGLGPALL